MCVPVISPQLRILVSGLVQTGLSILMPWHALSNYRPAQKGRREMPNPKDPPGLITQQQTKTPDTDTDKMVARNSSDAIQTMC